MRMEKPQRKAANHLIEKHCCNFKDGHCLLLDTGEAIECPQRLSSAVICRYFRHVLLKDPAGRPLELELFPPGSQKRCAVCGQAFLPASNRAKYCPACKQTVIRQQKSASARRARAVER